MATCRFNFFFYLFILLQIFQKISCQLKTIQDDDLTDLIRTNTHIINLFSTKNCPKCDDLEQALLATAEDLDKALNGVKLVKTIDSQMTRLYSPTKEPVLVFFRHGVPLLYYGEPSPEYIHHTFTENKEPIVKELTDETFEHLTQAATGATTGDWFIMFYSQDCVDCHRLQARWEAVGSQLKHRANVARMNKNSNGVSTANRFKITQVPSFILLKQGKLYRYQIQKYDVASFLSFIKDWYKNMKPEKVPLPKSPFDEFVETIANTLQENPYLWQMCFVSTLCGMLLLIFIKYMKVAQEQQQKKQEQASIKEKKKKNEDKNK